MLIWPINYLGKINFKTILTRWFWLGLFYWVIFINNSMYGYQFVILAKFKWTNFLWKILHWKAKLWIIWQFTKCNWKQLNNNNNNKGRRWWWEVTWVFEGFEDNKRGCSRSLYCSSCWCKLSVLKKCVELSVEVITLNDNNIVSQQNY